MRDRIYLDHAATTPLAPEALAEMMPFWTESCGNPSSIHATGREAHRALDTARKESRGRSARNRVRFTLPPEAARATTGP